MTGIMDKMLSHMMKSDMSSVFEGMKGLMDGRKTDLVHGFDIPPMQELKKGASADPAGNKNSPEQNLPSSAIRSDCIWPACGTHKVLNILFLYSCSLLNAINLVFEHFVSI